MPTQTPERKAYMAAYRAANPDKLKRSRKSQDKVNADRRAKYAEDNVFREQRKAESLAWLRANPTKKKDQRLRATFGISRVDFLEMLALQNNRCAICGYTSETHGNFWPVVDHCHATGKIRGLLCMNCNQGLGKFKDSYNSILGAAMYLQRNS